MWAAPRPRCWPRAAYNQCLRDAERIPAATGMIPTPGAWVHNEGWIYVFMFGRTRVGEPCRGPWPGAHPGVGEVLGALLLPGLRGQALPGRAGGQQQSPPVDFDRYVQATTSGNPPQANVAALDEDGGFTVTSSRAGWLP
jgi:hypothetical protein